MTTNVWLEQEWEDQKLTWTPDDYGQVQRMYVPSTDIWLPDIVLYNRSAPPCYCGTGAPLFYTRSRHQQIGFSCAVGM